MDLEFVLGIRKFSFHVFGQRSKKTMKLRHLTYSAVSVLLSSCAGPGFNKKWEAALAEHPAPQQTDITGPWQGSWNSEANGHTGDLRCIVNETGKDRYNFQYWATWGRGMKGTFAIDCEGARQGGVTRVTGQKKLGPFGKYSHEAEITPSRFDARFSRQRKNLGTFELSRPESE